MNKEIDSWMSEDETLECVRTSLARGEIIFMDRAHETIVREAGLWNDRYMVGYGERPSRIKR